MGADRTERVEQMVEQMVQDDVAEPDEPHPGAREEEASGETKTTDLVSIDRLKLVLTDGAIAWEDAQGEVHRSAHDVEAYLTPLDLPTRKATHIHVRASTVDLSAWSKIRDLDVELLRTGDSYRVLRLNAERQSVSRPVSEVDPLQNIAPMQDVIDRVNPVPPELVLHEDSLPAPVPSDESKEEGLQRFIREELSDALRP